MFSTARLGLGDVVPADEPRRVVVGAPGAHHLEDAVVEAGRLPTAGPPRGR